MNDIQIKASNDTQDLYRKVAEIFREYEKAQCKVLGNGNKKVVVGRVINVFFHVYMRELEGIVSNLNKAVDDYNKHIEGE